ncbi:unnamed protein product, partial [Arctogadus glacialis]
MDSSPGNGIHKKRRKEDKRVIRLPAIPNGPTSLCQGGTERQSTSQRLHKLFFSNCLADFGPLKKTSRTTSKWKNWDMHVPKLSLETERSIEDYLRQRLGHNNPLSPYTETDVLHLLGTPQAPFYKRKTLSAIKSLTDQHEPHGSHEVLIRSMAALGHEDGEEEEAGPGESAGATTTSNESGPRPSAGSDGSPEGDATESCLLPRRPRRFGLDPSVCRGRSGGKEAPPSPGQERRFMVYICGGYKDTVAERSALMEGVYPALYRHCKRRGFDFRMVDLRQGVGGPTANRHDTARIHLETIRRCQETPGPNFVLFLGQKHEEPSVPSTVSREDLEAVVGLMERDRQRASLRKLSARRGSQGPGGNPAGPAGEPAYDAHAHGFLSFGEQATSSTSSSSLLSGETSLSSVSGTGEDLLERSWGDLDKDLGLIRMWYRLDENRLPPLYRLLPISTHHPDILSQDGQRRRQAVKDWAATRQRLWWVLQRGGTVALGEEGAAALLKTVLDWETEEGLRSLGDGCPPEQHCHCYKRLIPDLYYNLKNEHAARYVDLMKGRPQVNAALAAAHQRFMGRVYDKLRHTNIYERDVGWGRRGLDPEHNRSHQFYTERICAHFKRTALSSLNKAMVVSQAREPFDVVRRKEVKRRLWEEVQYHRDHRDALARKCLLRQDFLSEVQRAAAETPGRGPLLLLGAPGSGKSCVLARASQLLCTRLPGAVEVVCFIGLTGESRNIRLVLQSLCLQLAQAYAAPHGQLSTGLPQLRAEFLSLLGRGSAARPPVLLLDGLDELSEERAADLSWLEGPLPPHAHLLLSAAAGSAAAAALQQSPHAAVLTIPPLSGPDIHTGLGRGLRACGRRLRGDQWKLLLEACESCPAPLYLEAALWESRLWTSYCGGGGPLAAPLEGLYLGLLARLEREHGGQLVRRVGALMAVSRGGCEEEELLGLLAKDRKVLQEIASSRSSTTSPSRVPYILWARLKRALGPHLSEVRTDGTWVYRWSHSTLGRVCADRYLKTEDSRRAAHADYAEYYGERTRHAATFQPLAWRRGAGHEEEAEEEGGDEGEGEGVAESQVFNLRKLHGLPFHLVRSGQIVPFMTECVFRYDFLLHKLQGLSVLDVEEELKYAVLPDKVIADVEVLAGALALSRTVLEEDPCQLASQIIGRLGQILADDKPVAPGDPLKFSYLHALLSQCAHSSLPVLVPSYTCLLPPGGLTHHLLAGHSSPITALGGGRGASVAVSCAADGDIHLWDLEKRGVVRTLGGVAADHLTLGLDDSVLVVCTGQSLQVREIETGRVMYSEEDSVDVPIVTTTCEGQLLVAFYDGSRLVKVFDLAASCSLLCCFHIELEAQAIHKDRSIVLSSNSFRDYVLFAY